MNYQIAYGTDTESIEDPNQIVLLDLPDECSDMDTDELEVWISENWDDPEVMTIQEIVGIPDVMESFDLAMQAEGIHPATIKRILTTVSDAIGNNA